MSEVTITVRGEHEVRVAPERATVHVSVRAEGPEREAVLDQAGRAADPVRRSLETGVDAGTLIEWSSSRLSVRAERPWNSEGKRLAPVYHASIDFTATFDDFGLLSLWVTKVSERDAVEIGHVDWRLTPETAAALERDAATEAIRVAVARAEAYAAALGRDVVTPVSVADQGLLQREESPRPMMRAAMFASDAAGGAGMDYQPSDIVVSATVEARFIAH